MNAETLGGASRPRRRRALKLGGVILLAGTLLVAIRESKALVLIDLWEQPTEQQLPQPDSVYARQLLDAVRGANGVLCGALDRTFDTGFWSHSFSSIMENDFADQRSADIGRWVSHRRFHESVLPVVLPALHSTDACERRVAARVAGRTEIRNLHERVRAELNADDPAVRAAAVFAVGFADDKAAVPTLRERLNDSDRNVRVAAIWALASIGDETINNTMIELLERDTDPIVRSAAAWALGRMND